MAGETAKAKGSGKPGPKAAQRAISQWIESGGLEPYPDDVKAAGNRLARLLPWPSGLGLCEFQQAIFAFDQMRGRGAWDQLPQRERDIWMKQFEVTTDKYLELIASAPCPPEVFGFPVRDQMLMYAVCAASGTSPPEDLAEFWRDLTGHEAVFDRSNVTLKHCVEHFRQQQRADYKARQPLPKPRDPGADRVFFVVTLSRHTDLRPPQVASVASAMLETHVEPGDVRRWVGSHKQPGNYDSS